MATTSFEFFVTIPKPLEKLLENELISMGITPLRVESGGIWVEGPLEWAYRICLRSRLAIRVLLKLSQFTAINEKELYGRLRHIRWLDMFDLNSSFLVDFQSSYSKIFHSRYGAQKTKDAIVDQFKQITGKRPNVEKENPDLRVHIYLKKDVATVYLDLSGNSLHQRGYRKMQTKAPLKENLAAAILTIADIRNKLSDKSPFLDPFCGSGTFVFEAALMMADFAPGLMREKFGFHAWKKHEPELFDGEKEKARKEIRADVVQKIRFFGSDISSQAIQSAKKNQQGMPFPFSVEWKTMPFEGSSTAGFSQGVVVCNPPYGERIGEKEELKGMYKAIGDHWKQKFKGWNAYLFTSEQMLLKSVGLKTKQKHVLFNGPLEARLAEYELF